MVRAAGIEPASQAWEAHILPMYYARVTIYPLFPMMTGQEKTFYGLPKGTSPN